PLGQGGQVRAGEPGPAAVRVEEAHQQLGDRRLAAAGAAEQGQVPPGRQRQVGAAQSPAVAVVRLYVHTVELQRPGGRDGGGHRRVAYRGRSVHQLQQPPPRLERGRQRERGRRQRYDGLERGG